MRPSSLYDYIQQYAGEMAGRVELGLRASFDPAADELSEAVKALSLLPTKRPLPAQACAVEAALRKYAAGDRAIDVAGETGSGKTCIGAWLGRALESQQGRRMIFVVTCPNQLVGKWRAHWLQVIPDADVTIVRRWTDLRKLERLRTNVVKTIHHRDGSDTTQVCRRWARPSRTIVLIMPRDRSKLSYAYRVAATVRKKRLVAEYDHLDENNKLVLAGTATVIDELRCPRCSMRLLNSDGEPAEWSDFAKKDGGPKSRSRCSVCKEALWQAHNGKLGDFSHEATPSPGIAPRRIAPAAYLRKLGIPVDLYLIDEAHELRGAGSLQGQMLADIACTSRRTMKLTGTMSGGYAVNMLHLMWRTTPWKLVQDGMTHGEDSEFARHYGVLKTERRYKQAWPGQSIEDLVQGRGRKVGSDRVKAMPGISPLLFTTYMLDNTIFIRLGEMHEQLPGFEEKVHVLPMEPDVDKAMAQMQEDFKKHQAQLPQGQPCRAWSAAMAAFLRWPDKPWVAPYWVMDYDEHGRPKKAFSVPSLPMREYPKERRIRRLVLRNRHLGRKTWIFTELTGRGKTPEWDWMDYLADYLRHHGIRCAVLRAEGDGGPKPEDREDWIEKTSPNVDVVISNPSLVQTGLDLYDFPNIIYAYTGVNTYVLRQASRRAWRLGQQNDCRVDYIVYSGEASHSAQDAALHLMSKKMAAALALEGDFAGDGLASLAGGDDVATMLARFINGELGRLSAKDAFSEYRERLEQVMPSLAAGAKSPSLAPPVRPVGAPPPPLPAPPAAPAPPRRHPGAPPAPPAKAPAPIRRPAPAPAALGAEPASVSARKAQRLVALGIVMGQEPDEAAGDWYRFGDTWFQLVAKARATVRARNFEAIAAAHDGAMIAFVEPVQEMGPTESRTTVAAGGVQYVVSFMPARDFLAGDRVPGDLPAGALP